VAAVMGVGPGTVQAGRLCADVDHGVRRGEHGGDVAARGLHAVSATDGTCGGIGAGRERAVMAPLAVSRGRGGGIGRVVVSSKQVE